MALETKITYINTDSTGRAINIKDLTGIYSSQNLTGYGTPNLQVSSINKIIISISEIYSNKVEYLYYTTSTIPTISQIAVDQTELTITRLHTDHNDPEEGLKPFKDGVYDINMFTVFGNPHTGEVYKGSKKIKGTSLPDVTNYFFLVINDIPYEIDKTQNNTSTQIHLKRPLEKSGGNIYLTYYSNTKAIVNSTSTFHATMGSASILKEDCTCSCSNDKLDTISTIWMYLIASDNVFQYGNYKEANDLLRGAERLTLKLKCKC